MTDKMTEAEIQAYLKVDRFDPNDNETGPETEEMANRRNLYYWAAVAELHNREEIVQDAKEKRDAANAS